MERERRWRRAESACARERQEERGRERGKGRETERARRRQALIELVIFKAFFLSIVCRETGMREGGRKKKEVHTDFKKSHFLFDRCGVSFAV